LIILYNEIGKRSNRGEFSHNLHVITIRHGFAVPRRSVPES
jgi:hypothetical protein